VLERSLIECSTKIGIDVSAHDPRHPRRTKRLEDLVEDASDRLPHLRLRMESMRETGNKVLHPKNDDDPAPSHSNRYRPYDRWSRSSISTPADHR
jgi:hypothetical protein